MVISSHRTGAGNSAGILTTHFSCRQPTLKHQPAPNICIYLFFRIYEFRQNITGDHPVPSTLIVYYSFYSSLCITDNACIYPRTLEVSPAFLSSAQENFINALPYSKSLVTKIYSYGLLLLQIPSVPTNSPYGVTSSTLYMIRISSPTSHSISTSFPHHHIFNRTFYISRLLKLASVYLRKIQSASRLHFCFA